MKLLGPEYGVQVYDATRTAVQGPTTTYMVTVRLVKLPWWKRLWRRQP